MRIGRKQPITILMNLYKKMNENLFSQVTMPGAWTDIFLGGATSKFARGARENFIALHLDFIALHLGVERYTSRWSAIKFSRATKNVTQHLN